MQTPVEAFQPEVSVLIAVHNGMPYVESAVRSMMEQTLRDIEIIVVDDASSDETRAVLASLAAEDKRIRIVGLAVNRGLAGALNEGLELARAVYVARMDADDIAMPTRLAVQKNWLDRHPEVVLLGTSNRKIDAAGTVLNTERRGSDATMVRWNARFGMPLVHPTFMFRRLDAAGVPVAYDPAFPVAQDYDFVVRALERGDVMTLDDVLLDWRVHADTTSSKRLAEQTVLAERCSARVLARDLPAATRRDLGVFLDVLFRDRRVSLHEALACFGAFRRMIAADLRRIADQGGTPQRVAVLKREMDRAAFRLLSLRLAGRGFSRRQVILLMMIFAPDFWRGGLAERRLRKKYYSGLKHQADLPA